MQISANQWISFLTILRKDTIRYCRSWSQTLLPAAITSVLYFLIFGHIMGARIGPMAGVHYIQYIAPGLVMLAVVNNTYMNGSTALYLMRFTHAIDEIIVSSTRDSTLLLAYVSSSMIRGMAVAVIVALISLCFAHLPIAHVAAMITIILLASMLFALAGFINGLYAKSFDAMAFVPTFILTPLTYLGGVFYSVDLLPYFWQKVSLLNPILYMVNGFRYSLLGHSDVNFMLSCSIIIAFIAVFYAWAFYALKKGVGIKS